MFMVNTSKTIHLPARRQWLNRFRPLGNLDWYHVLRKMSGLVLFCLLASAMNTPLSQCHSLLGATQYSAACQTHIRCIELDGGRQGGRQRRSEEGWMMRGRGQGEGGREGENKGTRGSEQGKTREGGIREGGERWEEAMMIGREIERQWRLEGGRVAEGNERGRDGARKRGEWGSERRRDNKSWLKMCIILIKIAIIIKHAMRLP